MPRPTDPAVLLAVAVGGVIGALGRYGIARALPAQGEHFPWATFVTNVIGCVVVGALVVLVVEHPAAHALTRPFLVTGVLGGFTTFSTFAVETRGLLATGHGATALGYVAATLVVGVGAVAVVRFACVEWLRRTGRRGDAL